MIAILLCIVALVVVYYVCKRRGVFLFEVLTGDEAKQFFTELNENGYNWNCFEGKTVKREQKPVEWSEEDEQQKLRVMDCLNELSSVSGMSDYYKQKCKDGLDWLKSLRPQPHWKPSEEQIDMLELAKTYCPTDAQKNILHSLIYDLKALTK